MKSVHTKEILEKMKKVKNENKNNEFFNDKIKEEYGITLLALVVTIIVLLILAGVTISSITGNNGILTRTKEAVAAQDEANRREYLDQLMLEYSMDKTSRDEGITDFLNELKADGRIEDFAYYDGELVLKYGGYYYLAEREESFYKIARRLDTEIDGGSILISKNNIKNAEGGKITLKDKDSVVVIDTVNTDNFNFDIPANATVTIKLMDDLEINNSNTTDRSAINLNEGSTLNLYVYGNVVVNSSFGEQGATGEMGTMEQNKGGKGGKAGIHVPQTATLNLYGSGTLTAFGGNATAGGAGTSMIKEQSYGGNGGGRRWSELELELVAMVGDGGESNSTCNTYTDQYHIEHPGANWYKTLLWNLPYTDAGHDGYAGENCGNVNIYNTLNVYAYGGAGSSTVPSENYGTNSGGSGYPAAGIGGGRSWRRWWRLGKWSWRICWNMG